MKETPDAKPRKSRKALVLISAGVVVALGIAATITVISVTRHNAETTRLCEVALTTVSKAQSGIDTALKDSDDALEANTDKAIQETLAGAAEYSKRSGSTELIDAVTAAQTALTAIALGTDCETRDDADSLTTAADATAKPIAALNDAVAALNDDVALFIKDEAARIAAEKKAAEEAAAAKAAAEAQAAAEAEAAAQQQQQWVDPGYNDWTPPPNNNTYTPPPPPPVTPPGPYVPDPCEATNTCIKNNI